MDYDNTNIPARYDEGREISGPAKFKQLAFFAKNSHQDSINNILDLGCGTARYSGALADIFTANVVGIDPSQKMIDQAQLKFVDRQDIRFELASGEALPLDQASIDMVYMSMVLHHLPDPDKTAQECHRILRNGGLVCIRNTVTDEVTSYPYLNFFPSIQSIIESQLIYRQTLIEIFSAKGFDLTAHQTIWHEISQNWSSFADKIALKADSFVARLEENEFRSGLSAIQKKAQNSNEKAPIGLNIDSFIFRKL